MATNPFERPQEAEQVIHAPAMPKKEKEEEKGNYLREFRAAMVPFEDMVKDFGEHPSDMDLDRCVNMFRRDYKKYFTIESTKGQIAWYLRTLRKEKEGAGTTAAVNFSRFLSKAELAFQ